MTTFESLGIDTKGKSGKIYTICPKCSSGRKKSKLPCLTVNVEPNNNWFNCQHCSFKGNLEAYQSFEKIRLKSRIPEEVPAIYSHDTTNMLLSPKGIKADTAKKRFIYEISAWAGEKHGQVAFPYFYRGNLVNVKFRRLEYDIKAVNAKGEEYYCSKNWQMKKDDGAKVCYWGLDRLNFEESQDIIITEGEMDALTWDEAGIINALSVPNGAINENVVDINDKLDFAKDEWVVQNVYAKAKRVFLALDDDGPGRRMMEELAAIIGKSKCLIIKYNGRKDINEVHAGEPKKGLAKLGKEGVIQCFENAIPYPVGGIITFNSIRTKLHEMGRTGLKRGYTLDKEHDGVGLNRLLSIKPPFLATVTGIPSMGKTAFWRWYMTKQSLKNGCRWGLFVPDARPDERELTKIAEIMAGKKWEFDKPWSMKDVERKRAEEFVHEHFFLIKPDFRNQELMARISQGQHSVQSLDAIFYYLETLKRQYNIFGYTIDAWNKIDHQKPNGQTDEQFVSKQLDRILRFNEDVGLFGSIIAHPTKLERIKGSRNYDAPDLYNVKGSSAWYEKSDIGITIHRQKYRKIEIGKMNNRPVYKEVRDNTFPTQIIVNKIKQAEIGEEGDMEMFMDWQSAETFVYNMPSYYKSEANDDFAQAKKEKDHKMDAPLTKTEKQEEDDGEAHLPIDLADGDNLPF
jgi:twinkle protein